MRKKAFTIMCMSKKVYYIGLVCIVMLVLTLAACSDSPASNSTERSQAESHVRKGGVLKIAGGSVAQSIGLSSHIRNLDEMFVSTPALETLGRIDAEGNVQPWLAEGWEEDPENLSITFELQQGVKFHDGTAFNAEAVKWNIDHFLSSGREELNQITHVDVLNDYTLKVNLKEWNSSMLEILCDFIRIVSPQAYEDKGEEWMMENPVGTGPFEFVRWEKNEIIEYQRFDEYWNEGQPYLDGIEFYAFSNPDSASAALQAGEVDVFISSPAVLARNFEESQDYEVVKLETGLAGRGHGLMPDSANPDSPFADEKVRKALAYAIDREAITKNVLHDYAIPTAQWSTPATWSYNDQMDLEYNPKKAIQLLEEAGYPDGFETKMVVNNEITDVYTAVQAYLMEIGINAELEIVDMGLYNEYTSSSGRQWEGLMMWGKRSEPDLATYMPRNFSPNGTTYAHNIIHPEEIQELFQRAGTAQDRETLQEYSWELQRLVFEDYALAVSISVDTVPAIKHISVQGDGINMTLPRTWTPETARFE